ncbi:VOC family protein [Corticibacterium sp. UT-5YL-CI-8]|nr:VOC family protein [Tianweitania sp. UT-5YL-CI-8]
MPTPNFIILYVDDPQKSAAFYQEIVGREPVESSPGFAMFVLDNGFKLGLWLRPEVEPKATDTGSNAELVFALENNEAVDKAHADWAGKGRTIVQTPTDMDFGYTFTALDPDGHRLRVYCVAENPV